MSPEPATPFSLRDRTVLVTGASSGLGREACAQIAAAGGRVLATGRDPGRLESCVAALPAGGHRWFAADLTSEAELNALVGEAGRIDGVVHAAGTARLAPLRYTTPGLMRELLEVNAEAPVQLCRQLFARGALNAGGSIVLVSSLSAMTAAKGQLAYAASKAALNAAMRVLARESAPAGIRCNALCPALVRTPLLEGREVSDEQYRALEREYPLGFGVPSDVALAAVFLLSPASRWITGEALVLDGGLSVLRSS